MRAPSQDLRPLPKTTAPSNRVVSLALVALIHVGIVYALVTGLAHQMVQMLPQNVKVNVIPPSAEKPVPPPPPPPTFKQPPPFVPPPDVTIDLTQAAPATSAITTQSAQKGITAPASVGRKHECTGFYPPLSDKLGEEGTTTLNFKITTDGNVKDITVKKPSGFPRLDEAAVTCASKWRYKPAMQLGQPVEAAWATDVKWVIPKGGRR